MARCMHYCERCGEETDGDSIRCDGCGVEMCASCASGTEIDTEECALCRRKSARQEKLDDLHVQRAQVMPCMRAWFDQHVIREFEAKH